MLKLLPKLLLLFHIGSTIKFIDSNIKSLIKYGETGEIRLFGAIIEIARDGVCVVICVAIRLPEAVIMEEMLSRDLGSSSTLLVMAINKHLISLE